MDVRNECKKEVPGYANYPTVSTDSVLIMASIYMHEGREVVICGILGSFLSKNMEEEIKMLLRGRLSELMVKISPHIYRQHMIYKNVMPFLYVALKIHSMDD